MTDDVLEQLGDLVREVFNLPDAVVIASTVADAIPGWDSLSHTILILSVEERFGVKLPADGEFQNVGELADVIRQLRTDARLVR